jgi:ABC-type nitrate/sulfonate/bicarbonate transport system substrate-binding protein
MMLVGMIAAPLADAGAQALKKISDGQVSKTAPNWPNFIAADKGFFRREGIELETVYVGNVANTVQQLVAGSFDVASSTFDTAVRAIANGGNAVMIGGIVTKYPYSIMAAANVTSAADMKGKRIVLPFPKDLLTIVWESVADGKRHWARGRRADLHRRHAEPAGGPGERCGACRAADAAVRFPRGGPGLSQTR